ncbi:hypothetical protein E2320_022680, partial [Naja naja]
MIVIKYAVRCLMKMCAISDLFLTDASAMFVLSREDVRREEWPSNSGSYLEGRIMPKRCSLSLVQGTDMS